MTNFEWATGVPEQGWAVGYETLGFSHLSTQYVDIPLAAVKNGTAYNPTSDTVQFAFMPTPTQVPASADWVAGTWGTSNNIVYPYNALCLVGTAGTTALTQGNYSIYLKVTDSPEIPVFIAGQVQVI
jgi:hypothetical protein